MKYPYAANKNHNNNQPGPRRKWGAFFYFICAEISLAEMWKEEARRIFLPRAQKEVTPEGGAGRRDQTYQVPAVLFPSEAED